MIESLIIYSCLELDVQPQGMSTYTPIQTMKLRKDGTFHGVFEAYTAEIVETWKEDMTLPVNRTPVHLMLKDIYKSISAALIEMYLKKTPIIQAGSKSSSTSTLPSLQLPVLTPTTAPNPSKSGAMATPGATTNPTLPMSPPIPGNITVTTLMVGTTPPNTRNAPPTQTSPQSPMVNAIHPHNAIAKNLHPHTWNQTSLGPTQVTFNPSSLATKTKISKKKATT
jgi:hypothetical protein